jgi:hypothetical protein
MLTAKEFKPDESNFYSKGLYQWLKKNPRYNRIYSSPWNFVSGFDPDKQILMVGIKDDDNWFHGNQLKSVCRDRGIRQAYAYGLAGHYVSEWKDVTDEFVTEYRRIGKCYIHGDHAHEFKDLSENHRLCINCGKEFFRKSELITKYYWESK